MKLVITAATFAAIIGLAVPAYADDTDDAFLASLNAAGIKYSDPDKAVGAGHWVCDSVGKGKDMSDVVKTLQTQNSSLSDDKANKFTAISANAYCPDTISATTTAKTDSAP